ncbi:MAG: methylenetetrahydrofolate reductase [NAD(P)H] [Actinomycetota bacterium]|nr:methylenetetrahydrofolate reductase [NAD(P)H] [Actinomycetota bacterium]
MAKISELLAGGRTFSFEFFPPKTDKARATLEKTIHELEPLNPSFVSVTYGAGGSTRDATRDIVLDIENTTSLTAMAHLTCMGHTTDDLRRLLEEYRAEGLSNILALAGDPPADGSPVTGDFTYASELVELVRSVGDFSIGVAAHPELHPRSTAEADDRRYLAAKLAQADFGITQFFFEAEHYLRMVESLTELGCDKPVIPGVIPVTNGSQVARFAALAGADFPQWLADRIEPVADDPDEVAKIGVEVATELSQQLLDAGAPGLHFYTLNRSLATRRIYANLGLAPETHPG